tara:strand:+ start:242 stop:1651 length:1410 start_codon:yes stop_codon:yes gene_type:complete
MILSDLKEIDYSKYPVVIFGSGPAGVSTALELERNNIPSIIIEAGDQFYSEASQEFYKGDSNKTFITDISKSRLRQFGGTSGLWGGWCKPLEKFAFDTWPITQKDLEIYQDKTCKILDIKNQFRQIPLNDKFNQNEFQYSTVRFGEKYENHIKKSNKILLVLNTQLSHFNGSNGKINSAICISKNEKTAISSKIFILACGGIENSRILLWSQEKNNKLINPDLPIGKYWMTHSWILSGAGILDEKKLIKNMNNNYLKYDGAIHLSSSEKFVKNNNILSSGLYMNKKEDMSVQKEIIKDLLCAAPDYGKKVAKMLFNKDLKCGNIFMHVENEAAQNNMIGLSVDNYDKNNIPQANVIYPNRKNAIVSAKLFLEQLAIFFKENDIGRIAMNQKMFNLEDFEQLGNYHHMGGTRMGKNIKTSVVDKNLKIHGLDNLYTNGSSNFSTGCYSNPTFTIIQLSLRLADNIKKVLN